MKRSQYRKAAQAPGLTETVSVSDGAQSTLHHSGFNSLGTEWINMTKGEKSLCCCHCHKAEIARFLEVRNNTRMSVCTNVKQTYYLLTMD